MKSPRDILFNRHQDINSRLDQVRHSVIAQELRPKPQGQPRSLTTLVRTATTRLWQELVSPYRGAWGGLAIVWTLLLAVNLANTNPSSTRAGSSVSPTPETQAALDKQRELLAELVFIQPAPKTHHTSPRSETAALWRFI